jgi:uncharacterized protein YhaN
MKITDLTIGGFGVFDEAAFADLEPGVTVFYGPNEAGKTTLVQFLRGMLYGFDQSERIRYLDKRRASKGDSSCGGELTVALPAGNKYTIARSVYRGANNDWQQHLSFKNGAPHPDPSESLEKLLGGVDEATFTHVYSVGLAELQQLGLLDETESAALIYRLTSGLDRVSLIGVLDEVHEARQQLFSHDGSAGRIRELLGQHEILSGSVTELEKSGAHWSRLAGRMASTQAKLEAIIASIEDVQRTQRLNDIGQRLYDVSQEYRRLSEQMTDNGKTVPVFFATFDGDPVMILDGLKQQLSVEAQQLADWGDERRELRHQQDDVEVNFVLVSQASRIEALSEMTGWTASLQGQLEAVRAEVSRLEEQYSSLYGSHETTADGRPVSEVLTPAVVTALRGPARSLKESRQRQQEARRAVADGQRQYDSKQQQFDQALGHAGCIDLDAELESASAESVAVRHRLEAGDRQEQLNRARKEAAQNPIVPSEGELLTPLELGWIGGLFVAGFMFALMPWLMGGQLGWSAGGKAALSVTGLLVLSGSFVMRLVMQRHRRQQRMGETARREMMAQQLDAITAQISLLDQQLGPGGGPLDARRRRSESRVQTLEGVVPVAASFRAAQSQLESLQVRAEHADKYLLEAECRWQDEIGRHGLPETLLPNHIRQHVSNQERLAEHGRMLEQQRGEIDRMTSELATHRMRVGQIYVEAALQPASGDVTVMIRDLNAQLAIQLSAEARRKKLRKQRRRLKKKIRRTEGMMQDIEARCQFMHRQAGCDTETEFRSRATEQRAFLDNRQRMIAIEGVIEDELDGVFERADFDSLTVGVTLNQLIADRDGLVHDLDDLERRRTGLHEKVGELSEQMRQQEEETALPLAQYNLAALETELQTAFRQWQTWELTHHVLAMVRDQYEQERQPETLRIASRWLAEMTGGKYTRVWTPIDQDALFLDDARQQVWRLETLSSGTRESVYLALRLALIEGYANRGITLPVILDDVLVNFDAERAEMAVAALCEFSARGHQLIFFTCHEHIRAMFSKAGIDARELEMRNPSAPRLRDEHAIMASDNQDVEPRTDGTDGAERIFPMDEYVESEDDLYEDDTHAA